MPRAVTADCSAAERAEKGLSFDAGAGPFSQLSAVQPSKAQCPRCSAFITSQLIASQLIGSGATAGVAAGAATVAAGVAAVAASGGAAAVASARAALSASPLGCKLSPTPPASRRMPSRSACFLRESCIVRCAETLSATDNRRNRMPATTNMVGIGVSTIALIISVTGKSPHGKFQKDFNNRPNHRPTAPIMQEFVAGCEMRRPFATRARRHIGSPVSRRHSQTLSDSAERSSPSVVLAERFTRLQ